MATQTDLNQTTQTGSQPTSRFESPNEGKGTRMTESMTSKLPSGTYLTAAVGAMVASAALQVFGRQRLSLFVGQWAPSILIMGLYNKLVKVEGSS